MMHGYRTSCNSKSKTGSADLSGMGFIHTIKTLKDPFNGIFRYSQAGICNRHIEILMIRIQCYADPSLIYIVFDAIFDQVTDGKGKFHLIHICGYRSERIQDQVNPSLICNRTETLQDILQQLIDIHITDIHICCFFVHFY